MLGVAAREQSAKLDLIKIMMMIKMIIEMIIEMIKMIIEMTMMMIIIEISARGRFTRTERQAWSDQDYDDD